MTDSLTRTEDGTRSPQAGVPLREQALAQLRKKRDFRTHVVAYLLCNGVLWLIWAVVLVAADGPWLPWPLFPMAGWGIGLVFHAWDTYGRKPFTETDIDRELTRLQRADQ